jgi:tRNA-dihydrouridine synthase B
MAESAIINEDFGAQIIDINMGCPVKKIVCNNSGAALMKNEDLGVRIAESVVKAVKTPVTVKMRLGWDHENINCFSLAKKLENVGVKMIAVHCRTRSQMYGGTADWSRPAKLKEIIKIPYICNGDIRSESDAVTALEQSGAAGIMVGRAAIGAPWLLGQILDFFGSGKSFTSPCGNKQLEVIMRHFQNTLDFYGEERGAKIFRKHFCRYSAGLSGAAEFRENINRTTDISFVREYARKFFADRLSEATKIRREELN